MGIKTLEKHQKSTPLLCEQSTFVKDQTDQVILAADRLKNKVSIFHYSRVFANTKSSRWPLSSSTCWPLDWGNSMPF
ncbi:hypothetical protein BPAE_0015g00540 [Botrytis paeoniae]|uniref:Uncharacterized protein n=1 Tax=Botrytis paeoniae TaxID=278948 RepID=A0A4Z1G1K5_9HELO|nr:hypothetical protein BPAE_0015g00540 [Botrytis paeoniae]